jgi:hypothetical protein
MSIDRLAKLKAMHLYGMAAAWAEHQAEAPSRPAMPEALLDKLIEAEQADRQARSLAVRSARPASPSTATSPASIGPRRPSRRPTSSNSPRRASWRRRTI